VLVQRAGYMTWLVEVIIAATAVGVVGLIVATQRTRLAGPAIAVALGVFCSHPPSGPRAHSVPPSTV